MTGGRQQRRWCPSRRPGGGGRRRGRAGRRARRGASVARGRAASLTGTRKAMSRRSASGRPLTRSTPPQAGAPPPQPAGVEEDAEATPSRRRRPGREGRYGGCWRACRDAGPDARRSRRGCTGGRRRLDGHGRGGQRTVVDSARLINSSRYGSPPLGRPWSPPPAPETNGSSRRGLLVRGDANAMEIVRLWVTVTHSEW